MDKQLLVSPSPHVHAPISTRSVMLDVIIALLPVTVASVFIFGWRSLAVVFVSVICAVLSEFVFEKICKQSVTVGDLSAVVTGLLLALNVPATIPLWQVALGAIFAIIIVKMMFGGIGKNFANPAITGRIFLLVSFGASMSPWSGAGTDILSGPTPLSLATSELPSIKDMLLGNHGGSLGETCTVALLVGGIYLLVKRVITWHTPVAFIGTVFVFTLILSLCGFDINPVYQILSGGLVIGAFFMATDYSTSPQTSLGKIIFGVGAGIITVLIRVFAAYPEGVSFAILLMNILTPYISSLTKTKVFGGAE